MPICFLEAPAGIRAEAKKKMVEEITSAINEAYHIPDVRIFLREYSAENVSQDGHLRSEAVRPVFSLNVPRLGSTDAKRAMIQKINAAIAEGYRGLTNAREIMVFLNEYPLENVGWAGRLQSDRPEVVAALAPLASAA
jgi:phenylpyruvate tautomerase PptA (4-oxalocrotonate tautomerase family)